MNDRFDPPSAPFLETVVPQSSMVVSMQEIVGRLRRGRSLIMACCAVGLLLAYLFLLLTRPVYTVSMIVAPPLEDLSQRTNLGSQLLSSVGLSGLSGSGGPEPFKRYTTMLTSKAVAQRLIDEDDILRVIYRSRWDTRRQEWRPDRGPKGIGRAVFYWLIGRPQRPAAPGINDVVRFLQSHVRVESEGIASSTRTVKVSSTDPVLATNLIRWIHVAADRVIRESTIERTKDMISYLTHQLPTVTNAEERSAMIQLLLNQENSLMLAAAGRDYAAIILDPPSPPTQPSYPQPTLTLMLGVLVSLVLGSLFAINQPAISRSFTLRSSYQFLRKQFAARAAKYGVVIDRRRKHKPEVS